MPADTFKVGSLVHLEKDGTRATYFVDHGRTPDEIVLKRVTSPRARHRHPMPDTALLGLVVGRIDSSPRLTVPRA